MLSTYLAITLEIGEKYNYIGYQKHKQKQRQRLLAHIYKPIPEVPAGTDNYLSSSIILSLSWRITDSVRDQLDQLYPPQLRSTVEYPPN